MAQIAQVGGALGRFVAQHRIDAAIFVNTGGRWRKDRDGQGTLARHRQVAVAVAHGARQHIALLAGGAHFLHLACLDQRGQRARHGGLADPQCGLQLSAAERPALAAQGLQNAGG